MRRGDAKPRRAARLTTVASRTQKRCAGLPAHVPREAAIPPSGSLAQAIFACASEADRPKAANGRPHPYTG
jgi:hypothetical protein